MSCGGFLFVFSTYLVNNGMEVKPHCCDFRSFSYVFFFFGVPPPEVLINKNKKKKKSASPFLLTGFFCCACSFRCFPSWGPRRFSYPPPGKPRPGQPPQKLLLCSKSQKHSPPMP